MTKGTDKQPAGRRAGKATAQAQDSASPTNTGAAARKGSRKAGEKGGADKRKAPVAGSKAQGKGNAAPESTEPAVGAQDGDGQVEKRPVGRPTVYRPEFCRMLIDFFRITVERVEEVIKVDKNGDQVVTHETVANTFPTLTRFADKIEVTRQTLHDWATSLNADGTHKHPEFSYAYARAKDLQESLLIEGGMAGLYDPRFASLASKNLIGWREQVEQTIEANVNTTSVEKLDDIYAQGVAASRRARAEAEARAAAAGFGAAADGQGE